MLANRNTAKTRMIRTTAGRESQAKHVYKNKYSHPAFIHLISQCNFNNVMHTMQLDTTITIIPETLSRQSRDFETQSVWISIKPLLPLEFHATYGNVHCIANDLLINSVAKSKHHCFVQWVPCFNSELACFLFRFFPVSRYKVENFTPLDLPSLDLLFSSGRDFHLI